MLSNLCVSATFLFLTNKYYFLQLHGCHKMSIDSNELQLANKSYTAWYLNLNVEATVTEIGTGKSNIFQFL